MSRGKNLQEMENAVTKGAAPAEPMQTMAGVSYEDLGGPTPENSKPDDDSNKLKDPAGDGAYAANLKSVKGFMSKTKKEEVETEEGKQQLYSGRRITSAGQKLLDEVAHSCRDAANEMYPGLAKY